MKDRVRRSSLLVLPWRSQCGSRCAFSLLEAVAMIVVLAVAVPPAMIWVNQSTALRADAANMSRAVALATTVTEHILADAVSTGPGLGFSAFSNPTTYVETPGTGLRARLNAFTSLYTSIGFNYSVSIGGLVGPSGTATGDSSRDVFRLVTVTVSFPSAFGGSATVTTSAMTSGT